MKSLLAPLRVLCPSRVRAQCASSPPQPEFCKSLQEKGGENHTVYGENATKVVTAAIVFLLDRSHQLGVLMASSPPCAALSPPAQKKREQLLLTSFALSSPVLPLLLLPQEGEHHTLSANQNSAPPSPSHRLSFQGRGEGNDMD
ncbi:hypothetical protein PFLUV_G00237420 [Perca fluviatilis]|uniref:Uncharacterized protein n=1 Tax=Perca fluviatilis TaxID=8168 RepID=A0A6A5EGX0_PERFL|nr:hypothetical protein PFLUV_G00237420 [Perca fluviatilis]